jgi:hypothetical protein
MQRSKDSDLEFWQNDSRPVIAFVPEHDEYLNPDQAAVRFKSFPRLNLIPIDGAKHLWVGEPFVHLILSEITSRIAPEALPLPTEY